MPLYLGPGEEGKPCWQKQRKQLRRLFIQARGGGDSGQSEGKEEVSLTCRRIGETVTAFLPPHPDKLDGRCLGFPVPGPSRTWVRTNSRTPFRSSAVSRHVTDRHQAERAVGLHEARISKSRWLGISQGQAGLEPEGAWSPGQKSIFEAEGQAQGWMPASLGRGGSCGAGGAQAWGGGGVRTLSSRAPAPRPTAWSAAATPPPRSSAPASPW